MPAITPWAGAAQRGRGRALVRHDGAVVGVDHHHLRRRHHHCGLGAAERDRAVRRHQAEAGRRVIAVAAVVVTTTVEIDDVVGHAAGGERARRGCDQRNDGQDTGATWRRRYHASPRVKPASCSRAWPPCAPSSRPWRPCAPPCPPATRGPTVGPRACRAARAARRSAVRSSPTSSRRRRTSSAERRALAEIADHLARRGAEPAVELALDHPRASAAIAAGSPMHRERLERRRLDAEVAIVEQVLELLADVARLAIAAAACQLRERARWRRGGPATADPSAVASIEQPERACRRGPRRGRGTRAERITSVNDSRVAAARSSSPAPRRARVLPSARQASASTK